MPAKSDAAVSSTQTADAPHAIQVIYADRIVEAGVGSAVSRLTLGIETGPNNYTPTIRLVMPTPALFEAIANISNSAINNEDIRQKLIKGLDEFKSTLMSQTDDK